MTLCPGIVVISIKKSRITLYRRLNNSRLNPSHKKINEHITTNSDLIKSIKKQVTIIGHNNSLKNVFKEELFLQILFVNVAFANESAQ